MQVGLRFTLEGTTLSAKVNPLITDTHMYTQLTFYCYRPTDLYRLCHKIAPMPIHLHVLIAFGMGLVVHRRVHQAQNDVLNGHGSSFVTQSV